MEGVADFLGGVESLSPPGSVAELLPESEAAIGQDLATADDEEAAKTSRELLLHRQNQLDLGGVMWGV